MKEPLTISRICTTMLDGVSALLLGIYALLLGPLAALRGPLVLERLGWYLAVFIPLQILSKGVRAAIDWRLGYFDNAIAEIEDVISHVETYLTKNPNSKVRQLVLADLYTLLTRAQLHAGHIDQAMAIVLRAQKTLGLDRLSGLPDLDAKTAHLVRAGLAAGKLLDGGGLATMFIKSDFPITTAPAPAKDHEPPTPKAPTPGATIIPFPRQAPPSELH